MNDIQKAQAARILGCYGENSESLIEKAEGSRVVRLLVMLSRGNRSTEVTIILLLMDMVQKQIMNTLSQKKITPLKTTKKPQKFIKSYLKRSRKREVKLQV